MSETKITRREGIVTHVDGEPVYIARDLSRAEERGMQIGEDRANQRYLPIIAALARGLLLLIGEHDVAKDGKHAHA